MRDVARFSLRWALLWFLALVAGAVSLLAGLGALYLAAGLLTSDALDIGPLPVPVLVAINVGWVFVAIAAAATAADCPTDVGSWGAGRD